QQELAARRPAEYAEIFPDAPHDVLNFGTVHGGIALNMIAEECTLRVSYRTLPDADPLGVYHEIERRLVALDGHDYAGREHRAKIETALLNVVPPLDSPRGTALEATLFDVTGAKTAGGALYATDGGWFTGSGITSLICGPGDLEQAHQPNEYVRREAFEIGPAMIHKVIDSLLSS
ncbi:MAG TPA: M20/M25/M40 family metallo-hydrolase, partial [Candidatus Binatus sp.]|uniref:M20/M25/M40 family metallo-hydrolase n=1 Tax=Candidatus Binatus sp. TaxID=2811406 RepID=UPI002F3F7C9D